jgi:hypothetical protein
MQELPALMRNVPPISCQHVLAYVPCDGVGAAVHKDTARQAA